jgi:hypothetical protein
MSDEKLDTLLEKIDADKRDTLKKLILGTAFVVPLIASFPIDGLTIDRAFAQHVSNGGVTHS